MNVIKKLLNINVDGNGMVDSSTIDISIFAEESLAHPANLTLAHRLAIPPPRVCEISIVLLLSIQYSFSFPPLPSHRIIHSRALSAKINAFRVLPCFV